MKAVQVSRGASSVHQLYIHLVFVTKQRKRLIHPAMEMKLREVFAEVCDELECKLLSCNADGDELEEKEGSDGNHVHVMIRFPPKLAIATLVNRLKGKSAYVINRLNQVSEGGRRNSDMTSGALWTPSYFVKTVGYETIEKTAKYLWNQRRAAEQAKAL
jgi:putative transposase